MSRIPAPTREELAGIIGSQASPADSQPAQETQGATAEPAEVASGEATTGKQEGGGKADVAAGAGDKAPKGETAGGKPAESGKATDTKPTQETRTPPASESPKPDKATEKPTGQSQTVPFNRFQEYVKAKQNLTTQLEDFKRQVAERDAKIARMEELRAYIPPAETPKKKEEDWTAAFFRDEQPQFDQEAFDKLLEQRLHSRFEEKLKPLSERLEQYERVQADSYVDAAWRDVAGRLPFLRETHRKPLMDAWAAALEVESDITLEEVAHRYNDMIEAEIAWRGSVKVPDASAASATAPAASPGAQEPSRPAAAQAPPRPPSSQGGAGSDTEDSLEEKPKTARDVTNLLLRLRGNRRR